MAEPPRRVVSINLCTDQLAMLLAAPGQLVSVSYLARDPRTSAMAAEALDYPVNRSRAEEVYLMEPDLVLGGTYSTPGAVSMLRRLGVRVETLPPAMSFEDIVAQVEEVGSLLGREEEAARLAAHIRARLAELDTVERRPRVALYSANGITSGRGTLADEIVRRAGFDNVADEIDLPPGGRLSLERLVLSDPDVILAAQPFPGASRSEAVLTHPVLDAIPAFRAVGAVRDGAWVCGLPQTIEAVHDLARLRQTWEEGQ